MNKDLKLRLTPWQRMTDEQYDFFNCLCSELGMFALGKLEKDASISVYIEDIDNDEDDTAYMLGDDNHEFEIYLDKRLPLGMMIDYLIHEMAHVRSWHHDEPDDHGPEFGRAYAAIYRKYLDLYDMWWNDELS